jgi:hypothetical protein
MITKQPDLQRLEHWQDIASAHSLGSVSLHIWKFLRRPGDQLSNVLQTDAWKKTFSVLARLSEDELDAIAYLAETNLHIATEHIKTTGSVFAIFSAVFGSSMINYFFGPNLSLGLVWLPFLYY